MDLGSSQTVKRFVVKHAGAGGESTALNSRDFNIQTSSNRYVRLNITTPAQDGNPAARIYEFEVY